MRWVSLTFWRWTSSIEDCFSSSIFLVIASSISGVTTLMWLLTSCPIPFSMEMRASLESFFSFATW